MNCNHYDPAILDEIDQIIYIADMDTYELLFVNRSGRKILGRGEDYHGKKCYEVLQGLHGVCPFCKNSLLKENGEVFRWDHFNEKYGIHLQLQDRQISFGGRRARLEIAIDISRREERNRALKNALDEQSLLTACVRTLNTNSELDKRIAQVLTDIGRYYHADRAYIFRISKNGTKLDNTHEWCADGIAPQLQVLQDVDIRYMARWLPAFSRKDTVIEPDIERIRSTHPDEYAIMTRQGIHSYMEAPLFTEEKLAGFLGVDNPEATMIGNSSAPILALAYAISNTLIRDATQNREREEYRRALHEMTASVPGAVSVLRGNLTRNTFLADAREDDFFDFTERSGCWDDMVHHMSERIVVRQEHDDFLHFLSSGLLASFQQGVRHIECRYRYAGIDGKLHFVSTQLQLIQNPDTGDVESVVYSQDQSRMVLQNEVFRLITSRSFDLVALLHLKDSLFEAVFLGDSLPGEYRAVLSENGARCSFETFCAISMRHMDEETRADYVSRLSPNYMRSALEAGNGSYEFMLKESFPESRHGFIYRKFLHYRLDSDPDTVLVIESDATEAVLRQQEELQQARDEAERNCLIMDSIMAGIAVLRLQDSNRLRLEYFNSYVFQMLGYEPAGRPRSAKEAKGTPLEPLFADALFFVHPDDKAYLRGMFIQNSDKASFSPRPFRLYGNKKRCFWMLAQVRTGISPEGGRIFYAAFHDVTEQIKLQSTVTRQLEIEKQIRAKADAANAAKSDFLSRMSHDMRTPLNGIIGMTYLTKKMELSPKALENLGKIDTSSKFLLSLVNDLLDMAKMESRSIKLHLEPYPVEDFNAYLDAVIRPLCREKQQKFILDVAPLEGVVPLSDITHLNRIYFNLLSNAVKYTPEGGTITLKIREKDMPDNRIQFTVSVSDNGIGMSRDFQQHLFEPFVQENRNDNSERRGSGLGLAIVKKTVEAMDGTIVVKSEPGKGTKFTFVLVSPCVKRTILQAKEKVSNEDEYACLAGRHVLLCEDHPLNQEITTALLKEKGMLVQLAEDGQKGVNAFSGTPTGYFDCILMDLRMPVLDGLEATKKIRGLARSDAKTVPILAMTADAFSEDIRKCRDVGMNGHIAKPIDPGVLYHSLLVALHRKGGIVR